MIYGVVYGRQGEQVKVHDVDFVSLVTDNTYGKPPILAPGTDNFVAATELEDDVTVLYINPANIIAAKLTKTYD